MMNFECLINVDAARKIPHGSILRLSESAPYEEVVDFMVVDNYDSDRGMSLMVSSGYKAGLILVSLPKESGDAGILVSWLLEYWSHRVYPECPVENVWVSDGYPVPTELPTSFIS